MHLFSSKLRKTLQINFWRVFEVADIFALQLKLMWQENKLDNE